MIKTEDKKEIIEAHIRKIMKTLGIKETPSNTGTPRRIAKMYTDELFSSLDPLSLEYLKSKIALFDNLYPTDNLIIMKDISFSSICEHHWLPFTGKVSVGYIAKDKIIGLSKIPRIVKHFSKLPQLQEKLSKDIGDFIFECTDCKCVVVRIVAEHQCVACRGIESDCSTDTLYTIGDCSEECLNQFLKRLEG